MVAMHAKKRKGLPKNFPASGLPATLSPAEGERDGVRGRSQVQGRNARTKFGGFSPGRGRGGVVAWIRSE